MINEHYQIYSDIISIEFNTDFYKTLKYLIILPLVLMVGLFLITNPKSIDLPIFSDYYK